MDDLKFFLGLGVITLTVIGILVYFGLKLNKTDGVAVVFVGSIVLAVITGTVLEQLGYPIAKRGDDV